MVYIALSVLNSARGLRYLTWIFTGVLLLVASGYLSTPALHLFAQVLVIVLVLGIPILFHQEWQLLLNKQQPDPSTQLLTKPVRTGISIAIALLLVLVTLGSATRVGQIAQDVPIIAVNLPTGMSAKISGSQSVSLLISAPRSDWSAISPDAFSAVVDVAKQTEGGYDLPVSVSSKISGVKILRVTPSRAFVNIEIRPEALNALTALDLIADETVLITLTNNNYAKRLTPDTYRSQSRGGKGVIGMTTREDDAVMDMIYASTHDDILFFTDKGRAFKIKAYEIPASSRQSKGIALPNVIRILPDEKVTELVAIKKSDEFSHFFFATRKGTVKRVERSAFDNVRKNGVTAVGLRGDDQLIWVKRTSGGDEIAHITRNGQVIVYNESEVRAMGRSAAGVRGINLKKDDIVIETAVLNNDSQSICVISQNGIGKRVLLKEFRNQHRGGSGIRIAKLTDKTGKLAAGAVITEKDKDLIISSDGGQVIRIPVNSVKHLSRQASGVILMRTNGKDIVSTLTTMTEESTEVAN